MMNYFILFQGTQILKLRNNLQAWREILVLSKSILLWEKQWYPTAIVGANTIFFMFLWLSDPNILTIVSTLGLFVTLADYFVPVLASSIFKPDNWTKDKEIQYEDICRAIVVYKTKILLSCQCYIVMRSTRPRMVCFNKCTNFDFISINI